MSAVSVLWLIAAYLAGAIPTSYVTARLVSGVDLRQFGSRNLGATNLYRLLGWKWAVPVGLFDLLKGALPTALAARGTADSVWWPLLVGVAAVVGHVFSPFVRFRGGKGVAAAAGVTLALVPGALAAAAALWALVTFATGYVSLGSILAAASFPLFVWLVYPGRPAWLAMAGLLALFILFTHRTNIRRLLAGTEHRFGRKAAAP
jgi:glycerol-3-phosphate acyltransferase PlsY